MVQLRVPPRKLLPFFAQPCTILRLFLADKVDENWDEPNYDFELRWAGPWYRSDYQERYPTNVEEDTKAALASGYATKLLKDHDL